MSAQDVLEAVGERSFDRVTVYRSLNACAEAGLLVRTDPGDRVWRFSLAGDPHDSHPHLVCDECGSVSCVDDAVVQASLVGESSRRRRFRLAPRGVYLHGVCEACAHG